MVDERTEKYARLATESKLVVRYSGSVMARILAGPDRRVGMAFLPSALVQYEEPWSLLVPPDHRA